MYIVWHIRAAPPRSCGSWTHGLPRSTCGEINDNNNNNNHSNVVIMMIIIIIVIIMIIPIIIGHPFR